MGLTLSLEKSYILIEIAGTHSKKVRSSFLHQEGANTFIEIPRADGTNSRIPVKRKADYLGTCLSYTAFEQMTFAKRVHCARITFHRLRKWLNSPHIALHYRLQLWRASVFSTLTYGLLAVNITLPILKTFQRFVLGMYRQLTRNHCYRTRESHQQVMHKYNLEHPLHMLLRHAQQLQSLTGQRPQTLHPSDIVLTVDWSTLQQNLQLMHAALEVQAPMNPAADSSLEVSPLVYACPACSYVADSIANLRRHQTITHGKPQFRTSLAHAMSCSVGGLPQCTFCFQSFSTWRQFQVHLDRQCCQVRPCDQHVNLDALLREEEEQRVLRLHQGLTENLLQKPFGPALIQLIQERNWNHLMDHRQACEVLAEQCCICDFHFSRPQELHSHLRVHHPKWTPHTFTKASQLCRSYASNSPCRLCGLSFRKAHSCPILTQVALLLLHMPAEQGDVASPPREALRCEVCGFRAQSIHDIHRHLADTHRLAFHDWQPERDLMGSDPACSHCSKCFTDVSAVRQHVTLGQCSMFDPNRSPYLLPIAPIWNQLLQTGDLQPFLVDPMLRMRMTLHCAQCGAAYTRSNDLLLHLQTAHSTMWTRAQAMTKFLLKVLLPIHSCVCNPSLNKITLTHVCPFYRQIAMLATRSTVEVFLPWVDDRGALESMLSHSINITACATLLEAIHMRQVRMILRDPAMQEFLREHCVHCGGVFHPALLRDHVLQVHASSLDSVTDLLPFLYDEYMHAAHTDYQCAQCHLIHNLPLIGEPQLSEQHARQTLVLAHFQQCPVIHQLCLLLQHGRISAAERSGNTGASGNLWRSGPPLAEGQQGPKRRRRSQQESQDPPQGTGSRSTNRPTAGGSADGQTPDTSGHGPEPDAKTRFLRLLHANGAGVSDPCAERQSQELALRDGTAGGADEDTGMAPPTIHPDAHHGPDTATSAEEVVRQSTDGPIVPDGLATPSPERQGGVLLPQMGCKEPVTVTDGSTAGGHGPHEEVCGSTGREHPGPGQHAEVPQSETLRSEDDAVAPADFHAVRRVTDPVGDVGRLQSLVSTGRIPESAHDASEPSSAAAAIPPGQEQGQREACGERAEQIASPSMPSRTTMLAALSQVTLSNDGNQCFINAAMMALLWAMLSRSDFQLTDLGPQATLIIQCLMTFALGPISLAVQPWFSGLLQSWPNPSNQGDPVEFLSHVLRGLHLGGFNMKWERRVQVHGTTRLMDQSDTLRPITVQFDANDPDAIQYGYTALQTMLHSWETQYAMQTALTAPDTLLCIHVDRYMSQGPNDAIKCERPIHFRGGITLPVFDSEDITVSRRGYQVM